MPFRFALAALLLLARPLAAGGWPEIPASVWQMKATDPGNELGAVFLDDEVRLGQYDTEYRFRIRIMSEAGKGAAQFPPFPSNVGTLEGRTVYPDGRAITFDSIKDFASQTLKAHREEAQTTMLIPPGLTTDCVVDLRWTLRDGVLGHIDPFGRYVGSFSLNLVIPRDFPILRKVIKVWTSTAMGTTLDGFGSHHPVIATEGDYRAYTFDHVPAYEDIPYSLPIVRERPVLSLYWMPSRIMSQTPAVPAVFWNYWVQSWMKDWLGSDVVTGSTYRAYLKKLRESNFPQDPVQKALAVLSEVRKDVINVDFLTGAQARSRSKHDDKEGIHTYDLDQSLSRGWTSSEGILRLVFRLYMDLDLNPRLVTVVDRSKGMFHKEVPSIFQFTDYLIQVPTADRKGLAWLSPSYTLLPSGVIPEAYQGTPCLVVDPFTWTVSFASVPFQSALINRDSYQFDLSIADGLEKVQAGATFAGLPLWTQRERYYRLEPEEQDRVLKDRLSDDLEGFRITSTHVDNAQDLNLTLSIAYTAKRDMDEVRRWKVAPFPGLRPPLWIPGDLSAHRTTPIVLPYALARTASSVIHIPDGYEAEPGPDEVHSNDYGAVSWTSTLAQGPGGSTVTVQVKEVVSKCLGGPETYGAFKELLTWMQTASDRVVLVQRRR